MGILSNVAVLYVSISLMVDSLHAGTPHHHTFKQSIHIHEPIPSSPLSVRSPNGGHFKQRQRRSDPVPSQTELALARLAEQVSQLTAGLDALNNRVSGLQSQIFGKGLTDTSTTSPVSRLTSRVAATELALSRLDDQLRQTQSTLQQQSHEVSEARGQMSALETRMKHLDRDFQEDRETANHTAHRVLAQETALDELSGQFKTFHQQAQRVWTNQNASLVDLVDDVNFVKYRIIAQEAAQNKSRVDIAAHESQMAGLSQQVNSSKIHVSQLDREMGMLGAWKSNMTHDVMAMNVTQRQLVSDVLTLDEKEGEVTGVMSLLQQNVTKLTGQLDYSSQSVLFLARLSESTDHDAPPYPRHPIILDQIVTNEGHAYDNTTGNFTVPVSGDYVISILILPRTMNRNPGRVNLMVDNEHLFMTDSVHSSVHMPLRLKAGQTVWLQYAFIYDFGKGTYFGAILVNPLKQNEQLKHHADFELELDFI